MNDKEIYKQTQLLAQKLAEMQGHVAPVGAFISESKAQRGVGYFNLAVMAQEFLCGHEMEDVVTGVEGGEQEESCYVCCFCNRQFAPVARRARDERGLLPVM